jgi:hypothetical protein
MKRIYTNLLSIALFFVLAPTAPASTIWYVNGVNGSDSNNCKTAQTACKTIGHAISLAASGDSIIVAAATYAENLTIGISLNVIGHCADTTIIDGQEAGTVIKIAGGTNVQVTLSNLTIQHGYGTYAGGIWNAGARLTINSSMIIGNRAPLSGGGISNSGAVTINNSTISGNIAGCGGFFGSCSAYGGGIFNGGGTLTINNSTLYGNIVVGLKANGGGIYNLGTVSTLTISNSTISGNSAQCRGTCSGGASGGGIWSNGSAALQNSIVAKNNVAGVAGNCFGTVTSHGYNLSSDGTCNFHNSGDLDNTDPRLGPLQNNGGPTPTMALLSGSPAIDAGNPSGCTDAQGKLLKTDQRGQPRPNNEDTVGCDMGAFEGQSD